MTLLSIFAIHGVALALIAAVAIELENEPDGDDRVGMARWVAVAGLMALGVGFLIW